MELIAGLIDGLVSLLVAVLQATVGLFVEGASALGGVEAIGLFFVLLIEFVLWIVLFTVQLVIALVKWRKPRNVQKPKLWRPEKLQKCSAEKENT